MNRLVPGAEHALVFIQGVLDRITYKPGYSLRVVAQALWVHGVQATTVRPDSRNNPARVGPGYGPIVLVSDLFEEHIVRQAFTAIKLLEEHEIFEWFRYDGRLIHDPHKSWI